MKCFACEAVANVQFDRDDLVATTIAICSLNEALRVKLFLSLCKDHQTLFVVFVESAHEVWPGILAQDEERSS